MRRPRQAKVGYWFLVCLGMVIFIEARANSISEKGTPLLKITNPLSGSLVFIGKGCVRCHTVWGIGETFRPDLSLVGRTMDFFDLVGGLWSHSPRMVEVMEEKGIERPTLTAHERLLTYIYFLGFLEEPGNYADGEKIYKTKQCGQCHGLGGGKRIPLAKYGLYVSPVFIAAELWNHGRFISPAMAKSSFAPGEMTHLLAYIRGEALNKEAKTIYIMPGNPLEGKKVFQSKNCFVCHGANGEQFPKHDLRKRMTEIVSLLWNHSSPMWQEMKARQLDIPRFQPREMANLPSFLYFLPFFGKKETL